MLPKSPLFKHLTLPFVEIQIITEGQVGGNPKARLAFDTTRNIVINRPSTGGSDLVYVQTKLMHAKQIRIIFTIVKNRMTFERIKLVDIQHL